MAGLESRVTDKLNPSREPNSYTVHINKYIMKNASTKINKQNA